ncbi:MAG: flagellar basal body L-ring protein FlgH [Phycisphaerae bacterium]|nr:flagellar basal body L-ring protein FlgH [Phycisphaerae bacterium]
MSSPNRSAMFAVMAAATPCFAQSLFHRPAPLPPPAAPSGAAPAPNPPPAASPGPSPADPAPSARDGAPTLNPTLGSPLDQVSLLAVVPAKPTRWQAHDLVTIIVNESTLAKSQQKLDTKKNYDLKAELAKFPSLRKLLEAQLKTGDSDPVAELDINSSNKFKGDGTYERKDSMTARIKARVLEVKPNGTMLIEARESVQSDEEIMTLVVSGVVDPREVTDARTVQSSQMADLVIRVNHEGQVKDTSTKGLVPRVLETIFNF